MAWRWRAGGLCAASGLALPNLLAAQNISAQCHAAEQEGGTGAAATPAASLNKLSAFGEWLRQQGADVDAIQFKESDKVQATMWAALLVLLWCWCALLLDRALRLHSHRYAWKVGNTSVAGYAAG